MNTLNANEPEAATITVAEAARKLGISRGAAYLAISRNEIPSLRFGKRIVVPRAALERLLARCGEDGDMR